MTAELAKINLAPEQFVSGFRWKKEKGGEKLIVGKWTLGTAYWNSISKDDTNHYAAASNLPGLKEILGHYQTIEEAKTKVEHATAYWLRNLV